MAGYYSPYPAGSSHHWHQYSPYVPPHYGYQSAGYSPFNSYEPHPAAFYQTPGQPPVPLDGAPVPFPPPYPPFFTPMHYATRLGGTPATVPLDPSQTPIWPQNTPLPGPTLVCQPAVVSPVPPPPPPVWESGTFPPVYLGAQVPLRLHPSLTFNPLDVTEPVLQWDIIQKPELARVVSGRRILLPVKFNEPAVTPKVDKIYITTQQPYLTYWMERWGPIVLEKADITVRDVLDAIHDYWQIPLTRTEKKEIQAVDSNKEVMKNVRNHRIAQSYDGLPCVLEQEGYKRSDVLGPFRRFQGMKIILFGDRSWKVYFGLLPGPVPNICF
ncbi:hypothetical protein CC2G_005555 [Coprinopsis cinerea AmutBmut pab1-1]|nr:hypothetical protein CC2G_005555 [Coprinopsis cinerea AmutBmut pab1-1]